MSNVTIELVIAAITSNADFLIARVPELIINNQAIGRIPIQEVAEIAFGWAENLNLAREFLANPSVAPNPSMINNLAEFQDVRNLTEWNNLSLEEKVKDWSNLCKKDLKNLRQSTNYHFKKYS